MKKTEELFNEMQQLKDVDEFLSRNEEELLQNGLSAYLRELLEQYGLEKSAVFKRARMTENNYGYELFQSDRKRPSRDKLLRLCLGFPLTIEETQKALRLAGLRPLYPRDRRDACILFAVKNKSTVDETNDTLYAHGEQTLD